MRVAFAVFMFFIVSFVGNAANANNKQVGSYFIIEDAGSPVLTNPSIEDFNDFLAMDCLDPDDPEDRYITELITKSVFEPNVSDKNTQKGILFRMYIDDNLAKEGLAIPGFLYGPHRLILAERIVTGDRTVTGRPEKFTDVVPLMISGNSIKIVLLASGGDRVFNFQSKNAKRAFSEFQKRCKAAG